MNSIRESLDRLANREVNQMLPTVSASDNGKVLTVSSGEWNAVTPTPELPAVSGTDNGKILKVSGGAWTAAAAELPAVSATDNGKILKVVDGAWAVASAT